MNSSQPAFSLAGKGWQLSFQRRVGGDVSANRGAIPCHLLSDSQPFRVLVPLREGEDIWLAWMLEKGIKSTGVTSHGEPVRLTRVVELTAANLFAADAFERAGHHLPINGTTVFLAATQAELSGDSLVFQVEAEGAVHIHDVRILLGTPSLYEKVTGLRAPGATTASQGYGGWRLP